MTAFSALLDGIAATDAGLGLTVHESWLQGRTLYGGLSAALCHEAAIRAVDGLPRLRSGQFSFVGPASGALTVTTTILRQGRSTVFIGADLTGDAGLAARAILCFGADRPSSFNYAALPMPTVSTPDETPCFFGGRPGPNFAQHFDMRLAGGARPITGADTPDMLLWIRHKDEAARNSVTALIALADAAPPAAMTLFSTPAPISTMTWSIDLLEPLPAATNGWYLMRSTADYIANGYSGQPMTIWDENGRPLIAARQNVAIFA